MHISRQLAQPWQRSVLSAPVLKLLIIDEADRLKLGALEIVREFGTVLRIHHSLSSILDRISNKVRFGDLLSVNQLTEAFIPFLLGKSVQTGT